MAWFNFFNFFFQCLVIICLVLARTGFNEGTRDLGHFVDEKWLNTATLVSYAFILPIFIITYLLGDIVPVKMVIDSTCWILDDYLACHTRSWFIDLYSICHWFAGNDVSILGICSIRGQWECCSGSVPIHFGCWWRRGRGFGQHDYHHGHFLFSRFHPFSQRPFQEKLKISHFFPF